MESACLQCFGAAAVERIFLEWFITVLFVVSPDCWARAWLAAAAPRPPATAQNIQTLSPCKLPGRYIPHWAEEKTAVVFIVELLRCCCCLCLVYIRRCSLRAHLLLFFHLVVVFAPLLPHSSGASASTHSLLQPSILSPLPFHFRRVSKFSKILHRIFSVCTFQLLKSFNVWMDVSALLTVSTFAFFVLQFWSFGSENILRMSRAEAAGDQRLIGAKVSAWRHDDELNS